MVMEFAAGGGGENCWGPLGGGGGGGVTRMTTPPHAGNSGYRRQYRLRSLRAETMGSTGLAVHGARDSGMELINWGRNVGVKRVRVSRGQKLQGHFWVKGKI